MEAHGCGNAILWWKLQLMEVMEASIVGSKTSNTCAEASLPWTLEASVDVYCGSVCGSDMEVPTEASTDASKDLHLLPLAFINVCRFHGAFTTSTYFHQLRPISANSSIRLLTSKEVEEGCKASGEVQSASLEEYDVGGSFHGSR